MKPEAMFTPREKSSLPDVSEEGRTCFGPHLVHTVFKGESLAFNLNVLSLENFNISLYSDLYRPSLS